MRDELAKLTVPTSVHLTLGALVLGGVVLCTACNSEFLAPIPPRARPAPEGDVDLGRSGRDTLNQVDTLATDSASSLIHTPVTVGWRSR
jgi:hypothetical protein